MRALQRFTTSAGFQGQRQSRHCDSPRAFVATFVRSTMPSASSAFCQRRRNVRILARQDPFAIVNNRHAAAEPAEYLPEFQSDISAAEHDQMLRHRLQLHNRRVGQKRNCVEPLNLRNRGPRPGINENFLALQYFRAHLHLVRPNKFRVRVHQFHGLASRQCVFARPCGHFPLRDSCGPPLPACPR